MIAKRLFLLTILAIFCQGYFSEACSMGCLACGTNECDICDAENFYMKSVNGSCVKKEIDNCLIPSTDRDDMICHQCVSGYALNQNGKNCQEVPSKFIVPNCVNYHWDFSCLVCETKFYLNNERKCEESPNEIENCQIYKDAKICEMCNVGYFFNIGSNLCEQINEISQCKVYSSIECQKCSNGYFQPKDLSSGNALTPNFLQAMVYYNLFDSDKFIYESAPVNNCAPGSVPNCLTHSSSDVCSECAPGYFRNFEGKCLEYPVRAIAFCTVYEDSDTCKTCKNGYYLEKNKCYSLDNIDGCLEFDTSEQICLKCHTPTHFLSVGICNLRNHSSNIKFCQNLNPIKDECDSCFSSFKITDDKLFCLPHIPHCEDYISDTDPNSTEFTNINTIDHICEKCEDGFYLLTSNRKCVPQDKIGCLDFDENTNVCNLCAVGYYLESESCSKNTSTNCKTFSITANECDDCLEGYFKNGTNCQRYSAKNCLTYSATADECASCNFGYVASADNSSCIASVYINCLTVNANNECETCPVGYYIKNKNCLPVSLRHCVASNTDNNECVTCEHGYYKDSANKCHRYTAKHCLTYSPTVDECATCGESYYKSGKDCLKYTVRNCSTKSSTADECQTCQNGYFKNDDNQCLLNKFKHCNTTDVSSSTEFCTSCKAGYLLKNDICIPLQIPGCVRYSNNNCQKCRLDLWYNSSTNSCNIRTKNNCKNISVTADACTACYDGFKLVGSDCIVNTIDYCKVYVDRFDESKAENWGSDVDHACEICSIGYYKNSSNTCTAQAINFCSEYVHNENTCAVCLPGFIKSSDGSSCDGNFDTPSCAIYNEESPPVCITCRNGYKLDTSASGNRCVPFTLITDCLSYFPNTDLCQYCIAGKLPDTTNTSCVDIAVQSNCARMRPDEPKCITCNSGFYLNASGGCEAQNVSDCSVYEDNLNKCALCNVGTVIEEATGFCVTFSDLTLRNIDNCLHYNGDYSECVFCMEGFYLNSDGKCSIQDSTHCAIHKANSTECLKCQVDSIMSNNECIEREYDSYCALHEDYSQNCKVCIGTHVLDPVTNKCVKKATNIGSTLTYDTKCYENNYEINLTGTASEKEWDSSRCSICQGQNLPNFSPPKFLIAPSVSDCAILTDFDNCSQCKPNFDVTESTGKYDCSSSNTPSDIDCTQIKANVGAAATINAGEHCVACARSDIVYHGNDESCSLITNATNGIDAQSCADVDVTSTISTDTYNGCHACEDAATDRKGTTSTYECANKNVFAFSAPLSTNTNCIISTATASTSGNSWKCQLCTSLLGGDECGTTLTVDPFIKFGTDFMPISGSNVTTSPLHSMEVHLNQTDTTHANCAAAANGKVPRPLIDFSQRSSVSYRSSVADTINISFFNEYHKYSCIDGATLFADTVAKPAPASGTSLVDSYATTTTCGAYYDITELYNAATDSTDSNVYYSCFVCPTSTVPKTVSAATQTITSGSGASGTFTHPFPFNTLITECSSTGVTLTEIGTVGIGVSSAYYGMGFTTGANTPIVVGEQVNVNSCGTSQSLLVFGNIKTNPITNVNYLVFSPFIPQYRDPNDTGTPKALKSGTSLAPIICIDNTTGLIHPDNAPASYDAATMLSINNCQVHFIDINTTTPDETVTFELLSSASTITTTSCLACMPGYKPTYDAVTGLVTACASIANCATVSKFMNACSNCDYDGTSIYSYWKLNNNDSEIIYDVCVDKGDDSLGANCMVMNNAEECVYCKHGYWLNSSNKCVDVTTDPYCTTGGYSRVVMADNNKTYNFLNYYIADNLSNSTTTLSSVVPYCSTCGTGNIFNNINLTTTCTTSLHYKNNTHMDNCLKQGSSSSVCRKCKTGFILKTPDISTNEGECVTYVSATFPNCVAIYDNSGTDVCKECDSSTYMYPISANFSSSTCKSEAASNCETRRSSDNLCSLCKENFMTANPVSDLCEAKSTNDGDCAWGAIDGSCLKCVGATHFPFHTKITPVGDKIYSFECIDQSSDTTNIVANADIYTRYTSMIVILDSTTATLTYDINQSIRTLYNYSFFTTFATNSPAFSASYSVNPPIPSPCVLWPTSWVIVDCLQYDDNFKCVRCTPGKYIDTSTQARGVCTDFHVEFCAVHDNNGFCLRCEFGYELQNDGKTCTKGTPAVVSDCAYYNNLDFGSETCAVCNYGHYFVSDTDCSSNTAENCMVKDTASNSCLSCYPGYVLNNKKCQVNYVANCLVPHSENYGICTLCKSGYVLETGICIESPKDDILCLETDQYGDCILCPKGYTISGSTCQLLKPFFIEGCIQYFNGSLYCAECHNNLRLVNGFCLPPKEIENCEVMSTLSNWCLKCSSDYYAYAGNCLTRENLDCREFSMNEDKCVSCHDGKLLSDGMCKSRLAINCRVHRGDKDECLTCIDGYYLNIKSKVCMTNHASNCKTRAPFSNRCQSCLDGHYLTRAGSCRPHALENCQKASDFSNHCIKCEDHYYLKIVEETTSGDSFYYTDCVRYTARNCKTYSSYDNSCATCHSGYVLMTTDVSIKECVPILKENCLTLDANNNKCSECITSHFLRDGNCFIRKNQKCAKYELEDDKCKECHQGMYLQEDLCYPYTVNNCETYNSENDMCDSCKLGFYLDNGKCEANTHANCKSISPSENSCLACEPYFYLQEGNCLPYKVTCQTYDPTRNACLSCPSSSYLEPENKLCVPYTIKNCDEYHPSVNKCLSCVSMHYLKEGTCITYSVNTCKSYHPNYDECVSCHEGFYHMENNCLPYTVSNCSAFSSVSDNCHACVDGHYLKEGNCFEYTLEHCKNKNEFEDSCDLCEDKFYRKLVTNSLYICVPHTHVDNCDEYDDSKNSCEVCKEEYYLDLSLNKCIPNPDAIAGCAEYVDKEHCGICSPPYYLESGICLISTTFIKNCEVYKENSICKTCEEKFLLSDDSLTCSGILEFSCETYLDPSNCKTCSGNKIIAFYNSQDNSYISGLNGVDVSGRRAVCVDSQLDNCVKAIEHFPSNRCLICDSNYYINDDYSCQMVTETVTNCEVYFNNGICAQCLPNHVLSVDKKTCSFNVSFLGPNCEEGKFYSEPNCFLCEKGYYLNDDGNCTQCEMEGCNVCLPETPKLCKLCMAGYYMNSDRNCVKQSTLNRMAGLERADSGLEADDKDCNKNTEDSGYESVPIMKYMVLISYLLILAFNRE